jgi:uncharacterized membrane protein required for colicin V production
MTLYATISGLNAVDVFVAIILATVIYIGRRGGLVAETINLAGNFCTIFVSFHYYTRFADVLRVQFFGKDASTEFLAFNLLAVGTFLVFVLVSRGWILILRIKPYQWIDKWGSLVLSLIRGYWLCGLLFVVLLLAEHDYATPRARQAISGLMFRSAATDLYKASYSRCIESIFLGEKINEEIFKLVAEPEKK